MQQGRVNAPAGSVLLCSMFSEVQSSQKQQNNFQEEKQDEEVKRFDLFGSGGFPFCR